MTAVPRMAITPSEPGALVRLLHRPAPRTNFDLLLEEITTGHAVFSTHISPSRGFTDTLESQRLCYTLLDLSLAAAVQSTLLPGDSYGVLEFRVHQVQSDLPLLRRVHCVGDTVTRHGRLTTANGRVVDAAGRVRAYAWLVARVNADSFSRS